MTTPKDPFRELMRAVFDQVREGERDRHSTAEYARRREDFAFHMTDWLADLEELETLRGSPAASNPADAATKIVGLLHHVVPHLTEAANLLLDGVPDPFADKEITAKH